MPPRFALSFAAVFLPSLLLLRYPKASEGAEKVVVLKGRDFSRAASGAISTWL
jgi:hypothetical protein